MTRSELHNQRLRFFQRGTSCAGMTAHFVLLAQTKVGFTQRWQKQENETTPGYGDYDTVGGNVCRATVALTREQKLCIIMGPLDMHGLMGATTVIGCLKYGAGCLWQK